MKQVILGVLLILTVGPASAAEPALQSVADSEALAQKIKALPEGSHVTFVLRGRSRSMQITQEAGEALVFLRENSRSRLGYQIEKVFIVPVKKYIGLAVALMTIGLGQYLGERELLEQSSSEEIKSDLGAYDPLRAFNLSGSKSTD